MYSQALSALTVSLSQQYGTEYYRTYWKCRVYGQNIKEKWISTLECLNAYNLFFYAKPPSSAIQLGPL